MTLQRMFVPFLATALFTLPAQSGACADAPTVTKASGEVDFQDLLWAGVPKDF